MILSSKNSILPFLVAVSFLFIGCSNNRESKGEQIAKTYCGSCHAFPDASLLDKATWTDNVLPAMSSRMGIRLFFGEPYEKQQKDSTALFVTVENWKKIVEYYQTTAPDSIPPQQRLPIKEFTTLFNIKAPDSNKKLFPSATYIQIDPGNHWIYLASAFDSSLLIFNSQLKLLSNNPIQGILVDIDFASNLMEKSKRKGILTNIGIINPNDLRTGTCDSFELSEEGHLLYRHQFLDSLPRPVQVVTEDLNKDNLKDYLVCGFGNQRGSFYWLQNSPGGKYHQHTLLSLPGAIKTYIDDYNRDGLPDIWVLMAQAREGIYLFTNKGNGQFEERMVLEFPPVYGSSYFELVDFNKDGYKDILYTCGDNADYTSNKLKNFHGVYIFRNDGRNNFKQSYFFPINGCYKAVARDFDHDGDLDIAAISFFPDYARQPQEAFVYLENRGNFNYVPFAIKGFDAGKWITMDAGDVDGDGDDDIVIGSLAPQSQMNAISGGKYKVPFLLLQNKTK